MVSVDLNQIFRLGGFSNLVCGHVSFLALLVLYSNRVGREEECVLTLMGVDWGVNRSHRCVPEFEREAEL